MILFVCASTAKGEEPAPGIFVRVENLSDNPVCIRLNIVIHQSPFAYAKYISRADLQENIPPETQWLEPGQLSSWIDVTALNSPPHAGDNSWDPRDDGTFIFTTITREGSEEQPPVPIAVSVANKPLDGALIRRIIAPTNGEPLALMIKNDLSSAHETSPQKDEPRAKARKLVWTVMEDAQATLDFVKAQQFPGKRPEHIKVITYQLPKGPPFTKVLFPELMRTHMEILGLLGFNTLGYDLSQRDLAARYGMRYFFQTGPEHVYRTGRRFYAEDIDWPETEKGIATMAKQLVDAKALPDLAFVHLDDEPWYPTLEEMRTFGPTNEAFREVLHQRKIAPREILGDAYLQTLRSNPTDFLFVEAENFQGKAGTPPWEVRGEKADPSENVHYFGGKYLWCDWFNGLLQMQKQIEIPRPGLYRIWVRHRNVPGSNALFTVEVSQDKKSSPTGTRQTGIESPPAVTADGEQISPGVQTFGFGDAKAGPMTWESMDVELDAGNATLTLTKMYGHQPWNQRKVDCLLLTTDTTFKPDDSFLEKTLPGAAVKDGVAEWQGAPMGPRLDAWQYVRLGTRNDARANPRLYDLSCDFRSGALTRIYANITRLLKKYTGADVPTTSSLCARFIIDPGACARGPDLFGLSREGGTTFPESADGFYYQPEAGPQLISFVGDILRGGADSLAEQTGRSSGLGCLILGFGSAVIDWMRLETYSILGRGARSIDYYTYGPKCFAQYDFFQNNLGKVKMVGELAHEIGAMEDMGLAEAKPVRSDVALVFSKSSDYQEYAKGSSVMFHELQWLYLALRHLHQQVDILTEDEVSKGILERRNYKTVYVVATNLPVATATGLMDWVRQGGVLFYEGGPFQDNINRPLPSLAKLFGAEPQSTRYDSKMAQVAGGVTVEMELDRVKADGTEMIPTLEMSKKGTTVDALYFREPLRLSGARALAHFLSDNTPAMTINRYGRGTAILSGALLGAAYMREAKTSDATPEEIETLAQMCGADLPSFRNVPIPQSYSEAARDLIGIPLQLAQVRSVAWTAEPLVEVNPMQLKDGYLILLSDYTRRQQTADLFVRVEKPVAKISLLQGGTPAFTMEKGVLHVQIPIRLSQAVRIFTE